MPSPSAGTRPTVRLTSEHRPRKRSRHAWKLDWVGLLYTIGFLAGLSALVYPHAASWVSAYDQSKMVRDYLEDTAASPQLEEALASAHAYNDQMWVGATFEAGGNVPTASAEAADIAGKLEYEDLLKMAGSSVIGTLVVPVANVELPIFHGTEPETLLAGVGHLEGTALPVGGEGIRSVLTAHRGLASATLFDDLDQVVVGDKFYVTAAGQTLTYRVVETKVVDPDQTEEILPLAGQDLVTLVTCTPIGMNTHRILVTGERVEQHETREAPAPENLQFPWWVVIGAAGIAGAVFYVWYAGRQREQEP